MKIFFLKKIKNRFKLNKLILYVYSNSFYMNFIRFAQGATKQHFFITLIECQPVKIKVVFGSWKVPRKEEKMLKKIIFLCLVV